MVLWSTQLSLLGLSRIQEGASLTSEVMQSLHGPDGALQMPVILAMPSRTGPLTSNGTSPSQSKNYLSGHLHVLHLSRGQAYHGQLLLHNVRWQSSLTSSTCNMCQKYIAPQMSSCGGENKLAWMDFMTLM